MPYQFGDVTRGLLGMSREEDPFPPRADDVTRSLWSCVHDQSQTALLRTRDLLDAEFDSSKPAHAELLKCLWVVDHSDEVTCHCSLTTDH